MGLKKRRLGYVDVVVIALISIDGVVSSLLRLCYSMLCLYCSLMRSFAITHPAYFFNCLTCKVSLNSEVIRNVHNCLHHLPKCEPNAHEDGMAAENGQPVHERYKSLTLQTSDVLPSENHVRRSSFRECRDLCLSWPSYLTGHQYVFL